MAHARLADPSPASIVVLEQSTAQASSTVNSGAQGAQPVTLAGSVSDGLGDDPDATGTSTGHKYVSCAVTGGKVTLPTLALSASAGASPPPGGTNPDGTSYLAGSCAASASVGAVTISIHAQPYNFRRTYFDSQPPQSVVVEKGALQFHYNWSSTSGNKADLAGIEIYESLLYPSTPSTTVGNTVGYLPPVPFGWSPPFYFEGASVHAESTIGFGDLHTWGNNSSSLADCFIKPYQANSFDATQNYIFYDPLTMSLGDRQFIPGSSGPFTITNAVVVDSNSASGYSFIVTKSGVSSLNQPLP